MSAGKFSSRCVAFYTSSLFFLANLQLNFSECVGPEMERSMSGTAIVQFPLSDHVHCGADGTNEKSSQEVYDQMTLQSPFQLQLFCDSIRACPTVLGKFLDTL